MALTTDQMIEEIKGMSVLDLNTLVKALEEEFGVSAAAAVAVAAPAAGGGGGDAAPAEEKTSFDVFLAEAGSQKIPVIKVIRTATGLGLKEAKDIADGAPGMVKEGVPAEDAQKLKAELEEAGATVELR
ncbi:MAG: 50S ribosomal protein L7/L12 [Actinobacteria bacterium]|jgi:large subunit ribosomal protein L7/L12|nr:50S ribosomal protein L7/L12 [Actinomycetota bacterium]